MRRWQGRGREPPLPRTRARRRRDRRLCLNTVEELYLHSNSFGDEGLAALVAPPPAPPAGTPPPPIGGLKKLEAIDLSDTQVSDVGCATLVAALHRGALPALEDLLLRGIPASEAAKAAVQDSIRANLERAYLERAKNEDEDEWEDEDEDEGEWDEDEGS